LSKVDPKILNFTLCIYILKRGSPQGVDPQTCGARTLTWRRDDADRCRLCQRVQTGCGRYKEVYKLSVVIRLECGQSRYTVQKLPRKRLCC